MLNVIEYKGIYGMVEYVPQTKNFQVTAISVNGSIYVTGESVSDIEEEFAAACEQYIEKCRTQNLPEVILPSGKIDNINISPELHQRALVACKLKGISVDELVERAIYRYLEVMI